MQTLSLCISLLRWICSYVFFFLPNLTFRIGNTNPEWKYIIWMLSLKLHKFIANLLSISCIYENMKGLCLVGLLQQRSKGATSHLHAPQDDILSAELFVI